jgi:membrane-associated protease RseP (regulator of RpoE activity)
VTVNLVFPKGDPISARLTLDTGGGRPAGFLSKSFIDKHGIMSRVSKAVPDYWSGMAENGPRVLAARLSTLELGDLKVARPIFFLWQVRGFGGAKEPDGLLCPDFLRRFTLTINYPRLELILDPGPRFQDETPFDASGTLIYREGENPYRVFKVTDGSPAAEAGLKEGDIVLEIDGRPASQVSMSEIAEILQADGRECSLRIKRGETILTVKVKLHSLI